MYHLRSYILFRRTVERISPAQPDSEAVKAWRRAILFYFYHHLFMVNLDRPPF
jgi:hypothetical protein